MSAPVKELDIRAAIEYSRQCREQERKWSLPGFQMADCMSSGLSGTVLAEALHEHFPAVPRAEVYFAVGLAVALLQADLTIAQMEIRLLRENGGRLPVEEAA